MWGGRRSGVRRLPWVRRCWASARSPRPIPRCEVDNRSSESIQGSVLELSSYTERSFNLAPGARTDLKWDGWYHEYVYNLDGESPNVVRFQSRFPNRDYLSNDITITYSTVTTGWNTRSSAASPATGPDPHRSLHLWRAGALLSDSAAWRLPAGQGRCLWPPAVGKRVNQCLY